MLFPAVNVFPTLTHFGRFLLNALARGFLCSRRARHRRLGSTLALGFLHLQLCNPLGKNIEEVECMLC